MEIHRKAILCASGNETSLLDAVRDEGTLDHIIMRAESCSRPEEVAAECLWCIANRHPFVEGNKRTAYLAARSALGDRAIACRDTAESERFIIAVASGTVSKEEVRSMINNSIAKCDEGPVDYTIRTQGELLKRLSE